MFLNMQYDFVCWWHILDYSHQILLGLCVGIFGLISLLLNCWLAYTFLKSHLLTFRSHIVLLSLCIATGTKSFLAGFILFGSSALAGHWLFGEIMCHLFAFLKQMMNIFQMGILTLLAIERYAISRPRRKDNELRLWFYVTGISVCWLAALVFALPPLLGYGRYNCDTSSIACELDWRWSSIRQIAFNLFILIFAQILPICIIFFCLWSANCTIEKHGFNKTQNQKSLTKTITIMTVFILLFWVPQGVLNLWIFIQKIQLPRGIPIALSVIAPIASEASEIIPVLCYLTYDARIRTALIEVCERASRKKLLKKLAKAQFSST